MHLKFLIAIILIIIISSCSINNEDDTSKFVRSEWHLKNVSGGLAGVNNDFDINQIIWMFDEFQSSITVLNNNTNPLEDGLDSGSYVYSILNDGNNTFLIIDGNEYGSITVLTNNLIIDQNLTSTGTGADGFIYSFQLVETIE